MKRKKYLVVCILLLLLFFGVCSRNWDKETVLKLAAEDLECASWTINVISAEHGSDGRVTKFEARGCGSIAVYDETANGWRLNTLSSDSFSKVSVNTDEYLRLSIQSALIDEVYEGLVELRARNDFSSKRVVIQLVFICVPDNLSFENTKFYFKQSLELYYPTTWNIEVRAEQLHAGKQFDALDLEDPLPILAFRNYNNKCFVCGGSED